MPEITVNVHLSTLVLLPVKSQGCFQWKVERIFCQGGFRSSNEIEREIIEEVENVDVRATALAQKTVKLSSCLDFSGKSKENIDVWF